MNKNKRMLNPKTPDILQTPCTISEAVQIAQGVVEDALSDYHQKNGSHQLSLSIQVDIIKELLYSQGIITDEEFRGLYKSKVDQLNEERQKSTSKTDVSFSESVTDIEVKTKGGSDE